MDAKKSHKNKTSYIVHWSDESPQTISEAYLI